ncbi:c-type cytochrome [Blattabacterium cuenoti]|uniref:c-type cytochrome n=1 Tax=Blattabacterium cuenoti TaxID=1653831 RepID=UPI00163C2A2E|nr:c-type cytochrome [Blattabacterium cuenoti]
MRNFVFILLYFLFSIFKIESKDIEGNAERGSELFKKNCTACHSIDLEKKMIGPALSGVTEKRSREWLHKWIVNNKLLRKSGDKEAIDLYKEYGNIEMNSFSQLSEQQIDDILYFIKNPIGDTKKKENLKIIDNGINNNENEIIETQFLIKIIVFGFSLLSIILLWILYRIKILTKLLNENDTIFKQQEKKRKNFLKISILFLSNFLDSFFLKKKRVVYFFCCFFGFLFLLIGYEIWVFLIGIDVNKGYKPKQPIYFSHKIHSGINGIDCQYCHSTAKYSKVSGIPSVNVCMNCHITINEYKGDYIEKGKNREEYNEEIQKVYHSVGWDPEKREYSGKTRPIQWIRIHNMPDFVHFDHSQHVITGKEMIKKSKKVDLVCNACHGEVQNMDQVEMSNDFTMGWCLSCHRKTEIDTKNKYYIEHFPNVQQEKNKTVDMIGGTECAKCHY